MLSALVVLGSGVVSGTGGVECSVFRLEEQSMVYRGSWNILSRDKVFK
jgi:hypothetical protein